MIDVSSFPGEKGPVPQFTPFPTIGNLSLYVLSKAHWAESKGQVILVRNLRYLRWMGSMRVDIVEFFSTKILPLFAVHLSQLPVKCSALHLSKRILP